MKQLTWKLILPLTIISFTIFTKWWYVEIDDEHHEVLTGFPLPYMCPGWHTSLSLQIFLSALTIDFLTYFAFWGTLTFITHKFIREVRLTKTVTIVLLSLSGLLTVGLILIGSNPDNIYTLNRGFEIGVLDSGYEFIWENPVRPDSYNYHPEVE